MRSGELDLILERAFPIDSMDPFADDLLKALDDAQRSAGERSDEQRSPPSG